MTPDTSTNVLNGPLALCGTDPVTGFSATVCATPAPKIKAATQFVPL